MLPSESSQAVYGNEQNSYWRLNVYEFFAEAMTTYIYLTAEENEYDTDFDAITQVDSPFYYQYIEPYFDDLF